MKNMLASRNPYLLFLPFLLGYLVLVLLIQKNVLWGDEVRHFEEAKNLLHGFYADPKPNVEIRNGPGYPILITPFLLLHLPVILLKLLNAVFLYLSIVFLFKALIQIVSFKIALGFGIFWGCNYNALEYIAALYAEVFSIFLVSLTLFLLVKIFCANNTANSKKYIFLTGFIIGWLVLTKVIFGYVLLCMLLGCVFLWLISKKAKNYKKAVMVFLIAFATVSPYLIYTYQLTGKIFYWSTSGGNNLYWMSSPYENEYGNWYPGTALGLDSVILSPDKNLKLQIASAPVGIPGTEDSLRAHHLENYKAIYKYSGVERDEAFNKIVFENIKAHPVKFIQNCFSNLGRILFNYPYSYSPQKPGTLARMPINGAIVLMALFCLIPTCMNWRKIIFPVRLVFFIGLLYMGGSLLGSADFRMFTVIAPAFLLWIAYIFHKTLKVDLRFSGSNN